ncbi:nodulation protein NfeD [bacterium]|nr:nodulation protein NfeD [bacterium]
MYYKFFNALVILLLLIGVQFADSLAAQPVEVIKIDGIINPVSAKFIIESLEQAEAENAVCLIIELDTPGGLMTSMRQIVKKILTAKIPVVVYVFPSGSRAGSAGVFITLAAHIAAMAPGTNIGAAHPVTLGGARDTSSTMTEKITNDAAAFIKTIAEKRHRNTKWAEQAVRKSVSITEKEALKANVIDLVVPTVDSLLQALDGRKVELDGKQVTLRTKNAPVIFHQMNLRYRILDKISDPNIAYILLLLGLYGIIFELQNPGAILPGVAGVIFLILAFFAMQTLPINWAGLLLIIFAIVLFILEIKIVSYGLLTLGGIVSMVLGSLMLFESPYPFLKVSLSVIIPAVITTVLFFLLAIGLGIRAQWRKPATGKEGIIGEVGVALTRIYDGGQVKIHGEIWKATAEKPIKKGRKVKVVAVEGLCLKVQPYSERS